MAIRGISDIIGCINGKFFCLEVKRSEAESRKTTGRIVLQKKFIQDIRDCRGFGEIIYPENQDEVIQRLIGWGNEEI